MKTIIDIDTVTLKVALKTVPQEYIECSVCGQYHPEESYCKDGVMVRTNCFDCYNLPMEEFKLKQIMLASIKKSNDYFLAKKKLAEIINYRECSIPVETMITALQKLPPNSHLVVTQEGYYAGGNLTNCFLPELAKQISDNLYFAIGHSSQNC